MGKMCEKQGAGKILDSVLGSLIGVLWTVGRVF